MNLLDENIRQDQSDQLRRWRIKFRRLDTDLGCTGIKDPQVIRIPAWKVFPQRDRGLADLHSEVVGPRVLRG